MIRVTNPTLDFWNMTKKYGILIDGSEVFDGPRLAQIDVVVDGDPECVIAHWILWEGYGDRFNYERFTVLKEETI